MEHSLEHVKRTYHMWGRHPALYKLACVLTFLGRENKLRKRAVEVLCVKEGDVVLDLACGTGLNFQYLEKAVGDTGRIIAFDYSVEMLSKARQRAKEHKWDNINFIHGDAAELSLDRRVDGVLSTLGVSAIPQHKEALRRAVKFLKNGRRISILDARLPSGFLRIFNPFIAFVYKHWASWDYNKNIPADLRQLIYNTRMELYNGGAIYIIHGIKKK